MTSSTFNEFLAEYGISQTNLMQIGLTVLLLILYWISRKIIARVVRKRALKNNFIASRRVYMNKLLNVLTFVVLLLLLSLVWNITFKGLTAYLATFFTIVGIGFFAQWSILSNITASAILYFQHPFRIGEQIKIFDGDNSIKGDVLDIGAFWIKMKLESGEESFYPNNLVIQRPIIRTKK